MTTKEAKMKGNMLMECMQDSTESITSDGDFGAIQIIRNMSPIHLSHMIQASSYKKYSCGMDLSKVF